MDLSEEKALARLLFAIGKGGEKRRGKKKAKDYTEELRGFSLPSLQYKPKPFHRCFARNGVYRSLDRFASIEFLVQTAENDAQDCGGNDGN